MNLQACKQAKATKAFRSFNKNHSQSDPSQSVNIQQKQSKYELLNNRMAEDVGTCKNLSIVSDINCIDKSVVETAPVATNSKIKSADFFAMAARLTDKKQTYGSPSNIK